MPQDPRLQIDPEARKEIEEAQKIVNKSQTIIDGLRDNQAWAIVIDDFKANRQRLDDKSQSVTDEKKWYEYRVTKMAVMKVINRIRDYEFDMKLAADKIDKIRKSTEEIPADVDND